MEPDHQEADSTTHWLNLQNLLNTVRPVHATTSEQYQITSEQLTEVARQLTQYAQVLKQTAEQLLTFEQLTEVVRQLNQSAQMLNQIAVLLTQATNSNLTQKKVTTPITDATTVQVGQKTHPVSPQILDGIKHVIQAIEKQLTFKRSSSSLLDVVESYQKKSALVDLRNAVQALQSQSIQKQKFNEELEQHTFRHLLVRVEGLKGNEYICTDHLEQKPRCVGGMKNHLESRHLKEQSKGSAKTSPKSKAKTSPKSKAKTSPKSNTPKSTKDASFADTQSDNGPSDASESYDTGPQGTDQMNQGSPGLVYPSGSQFADGHLPTTQPVALAKTSSVVFLGHSASAYGSMQTSPEATKQLEGSAQISPKSPTHCAPNKRLGDDIGSGATKQQRLNEGHKEMQRTSSNSLEQPDQDIGRFLSQDLQSQQMEFGQQSDDQDNPTDLQYFRLQQMNYWQFSNASTQSIAHDPEDYLWFG